MKSKKVQYDSITRDKNGKVLVIVIDGKPIIDQKEIQKLLNPKGEDND